MLLVAYDVVQGTFDQRHETEAIRTFPASTSKTDKWSLLAFHACLTEVVKSSPPTTDFFRTVITVETGKVYFYTAYFTHSPNLLSVMGDYDFASPPEE